MSAPALASAADAGSATQAAPSRGAIKQSRVTCSEFWYNLGLGLWRFPSRVKVWLVVLAPIMLSAYAVIGVDYAGGLVAAATTLGALTLPVFVISRGGLIKVTGLAHSGWPAAITYVTLRLTGDSVGPRVTADADGTGLWLWFVLTAALGWICIFVDVLDVVMWSRGMHAIVGHEDTSRTAADNVFKTVPPYQLVKSVLMAASAAIFIGSVAMLASAHATAGMAALTPSSVPGDASSNLAGYAFGTAALISSELVGALSLRTRPSLTAAYVAAGVTALWALLSGTAAIVAVSSGHPGNLGLGLAPQLEYAGARACTLLVATGILGAASANVAYGAHLETQKLRAAANAGTGSARS